MPYKIIVADASPTLQRIVQGAFPETEFQLILFDDGAEIMTSAAGIRPDAVLLSLSLEGRDGSDIARFLRKQPETRRVPLFFLKGAFEAADAGRIGGVEPDGIFVKPFDSERLVAEVRRAIERRTTPTTIPEEPLWAEDGVDREVRKAAKMTAPGRPEAGADPKEETTGGFLRNKTAMTPQARVREWVRAEIWELERELEKRIRAKIVTELERAARSEKDPGAR